MTVFDDLPIARHIRELRRTSGGSQNCGWMYDEVAFLLYALLKWYKPDLVIQTGHLWGKSASTVLDAMNDGFLTGQSTIEDTPQNADGAFSAFVEGNRPTINSPRFISIDPFCQGVPHSSDAIARLRYLHSNFEFQPLPSGEFFKGHCARLQQQYAGKRILAIIDGDHSSLGCLLDLENVAQLGADFIFLDDTQWIPQIGQVARAFAHKRGYAFLDLSLYNGVGLLYRPSNSKPAAPCSQGSRFENSMHSVLLGAYRLAGLRLGAGLAFWFQTLVRRVLKR